MGRTHPTHDRWRSRPAAATALRVLLFLAPIAVSLAVTLGVRTLLPTPATLAGKIALVVGLLALAVVVAIGVDRLGRRLLPLVALLKLSMLFPHRAPSRFAVAREAGSLRTLERRLERLDREPGNGEESQATVTILALASAMEAHDRRMRGHGERVRVYTDMIGEEMRLPTEDRYRLRWAALLHDVGKVTVSLGILNKPGQLSEPEWEVIRRHPQEGARLAGSLLDWLGDWGGAIAEHHERIDGRGYPTRKSGEGISLAARIVAVADAYDTMTAVRSYRQPVAVREAREELARNAGTQFDDDVVRAFFAISLPRLLWAAGPLALLVQLPFLRKLKVSGKDTIAAAGQGVAMVAVIAGVAAISLAGPGGTDTSAQGAGPGGDGGGQPAVTAPATAPSTATGGTGPSDGSTSGSGTHGGPGSGTGSSSGPGGGTSGSLPGTSQGSGAPPAGSGTGTTGPQTQPNPPTQPGTGTQTPGGPRSTTPPTTRPPTTRPPTTKPPTTEPPGPKPSGPTLSPEPTPVPQPSDPH